MTYPNHSLVRILLITDKFIPERGGSQVMLGSLYAELRGHEVTVLTRQAPGDVEADRTYPHRVVRVPYSRIPKLRGPLLWTTLARKARALAAETPFDQIHCGQTVETAPAGTRLARKLGLPSLLHTFAEDVTTYIRHPYYGRLLRQGLRDATVVTTISRFTVDQLRGLGVADDRMVLQYPGVDPDRWQPGGEAAVRQRFGLEGKRVLLTVARLAPRKGQDCVLRALPAILKQVPDCVYLIAGSGPEEPRLRALVAELGLEEHVRFAGTVSDREIGDFYHAGDVFVMANRQLANGDVEGFGLVFLEANACGKPVVGGRSGGAVDAIADGESGLLVDPENADELSGALIRLLSDPDLARRMGEQGRRRVREQFTWKQTALRLEEAIRLADQRMGAVRG